MHIKYVFDYLVLPFSFFFVLQKFIFQADCLKELLDYYEQYNHRDKSQKTRQELEQIKQTCDAQSDHQEEDNEQKDEEVGDSDKNTSSISDDETGVTQFLETLSSDSGQILLLLWVSFHSFILWPNYYTDGLEPTNYIQGKCQGDPENSSKRPKRPWKLWELSYPIRIQ